MLFNDPIRSRQHVRRNHAILDLRSRIAVRDKLWILDWPVIELLDPLWLEYGEELSIRFALQPSD
jgi:hypothetical protein